jgi:hypothetical protein
MGGQRIVTGPQAQRRGIPDRGVDLTDGRARQPLLHVILRDVTQRVQNEEALLRSREEIRNLALAASSAREQEKRPHRARAATDELGPGAQRALKIDRRLAAQRLEASPDGISEKLSAMQTLLDGRLPRRGAFPRT